MTKVPDSLKDAGDVEITPEMIEAGAEELHRFNMRFESFEDGAERIFWAMYDALPRVPG